MVDPVHPCDTPSEIDKLIRAYKKSADSVQGMTKQLQWTGNHLLAGWHGAAERMTSREIKAAGTFCARLGTALDNAATALETYRKALVEAQTALKPTTATPTPDNAAVLAALNKKAGTAAQAIVDASEMIGRGDKDRIAAAIGARLPFQRDDPVVPGSGAKAPKFPGRISAGHGATHVREVQELLRARGWRITPTGKWDAQTARVVRQFQINKHLGRTGYVDAATWKAIWTRKIVW